MRTLAAGFLLVLVLVCQAPAQNSNNYELVESKGTVTDYAQVVEPAAVEKVNTMAEDLRRITSVNFKVLVIRQLPPGVEVTTYGQNIYRLWDVGRSEGGLEHGVLLLISIIDRQAKVIAGSEVEYVISKKSQEQTEWDVLAALSRGRFSDGVEIGATEVSNKILAGWYATHKPAGFGFDWKTASLPIFFLFLAALILPLVSSGGLLMGLSIFLGGLFGYMFLSYLGMVLVAALGFFLNFGWGRSGPEAPPAPDSKKRTEEKKE